MYKVFGDFETFGIADLKQIGASKYANDPATGILCFYFHSEDNAGLWLPLDGKKKHPFLMQAAKDPNAIFIFHNSFFDRSIWNTKMTLLGYPELPIERTRDNMAKAYSHGLSGSLAEAAIALKLPISKDLEGRDNMLSLSKPRKNGTFWTPQDKPEAFKKLYEYCKTDVEVMRLIDETLPDLSPKEQRTWFIDQRINAEGIRVDVGTIKTAISLSDNDLQNKKRVFRQLTGDSPDNPRRRAMLLVWLRKNGLADLQDTKKSTLENILANEEISDEVKLVIEICISSGKTSLAKYSKMLERADENGVIRELLQYHGAHTGRWAGRGIQIHNFPRPNYAPDTVLDTVSYDDEELFSMLYSDPALALSSMLRKVIIAPNGHIFFGADFSQIEARVLAWLAGQKSKLEAYEQGVDIYCQTASEIFGTKISKEDKAERQVGKVAELALGYGGGIGAFVTMSNQYNLDISPLYESMWKKANPWEKQQAEISFDRFGAGASKEVGLTADLIKQRWRNANKAIVDYWQRVEEAARMAIRNEGLSVKQLYTVNRLGNGTRFLQCRLPSGRNFSYLDPRLDGNTISYNAPKYGVSKTYGGELVENLVQAVSRDILAEALVRLENDFPAAMTIHDEVVCVPKENNERQYREFERIMRQTPVWANRLPIDVECWKGSRYGK
jgi:DNA polymerase bacteriophage-type